MIDEELDFILKTIDVIDKNLTKLEDRINKFQEDSDSKFINQFQELDAMRFDLGVLKERIKSKPYLTDGGRI